MTPRLERVDHIHVFVNDRTIRSSGMQTSWASIASLASNSGLPMEAR